MVTGTEREAELIRYINLKLAALGQPVSEATVDPHFLEIAGPLLRNHYQKDQMLSGRLCPVDARIQSFLDGHLGEGTPRLPGTTLVLDRPGMARVTSLPAGEDRLGSPYLQSYRLKQGVLHNPRSDRRTTQGIFHVVEGGLPIPADKVAVPKTAFLQINTCGLRSAARSDGSAIHSASKGPSQRLRLSLAPSARLSGHRQ